MLPLVVRVVRDVRIVRVVKVIRIVGVVRVVRFVRVKEPIACIPDLQRESQGYYGDSLFVWVVRDRFIRVCAESQCK